MKRKLNLFKGINILTIVSTLVGVIGLYIAFSNKWPPLVIQKTDRFSCELMPNPDEGEVWTVMYRKDKEKNPWLKIAATLGDNWTPAERCQEIARRLEVYRQDGLTQLTYRSDPNTPKQYVICAKTKIGGDNCPLLVTLKPDANPYSSLKYMAEKLIAETGNASSQPRIDINFGNNSNYDPLQPWNDGKSNTYVFTPLVVDLEGYLADEDRKAGE